MFYYVVDAAERLDNLRGKRQSSRRLNINNVFSQIIGGIVIMIIMICVMYYDYNDLYFIIINNIFSVFLLSLLLAIIIH